MLLFAYVLCFLETFYRRFHIYCCNSLKRLPRRSKIWVAVFHKCLYAAHYSAPSVDRAEVVGPILDDLVKNELCFFVWRVLLLASLLIECDPRCVSRFCEECFCDDRCFVLVGNFCVFHFFYPCAKPMLRGEIYTHCRVCLEDDSFNTAFFQKFERIIALKLH